MKQGWSRNRRVAGLAALAGVLGALSALCGKVAFDKHAAQALAALLVASPGRWLCWAVRSLAGSALAAATVGMTVVFSRALDASDSSLLPTVVSTTTNFLVSVCSYPFC